MPPLPCGWGNKRNSEIMHINRRFTVNSTLTITNTTYALIIGRFSLLIQYDFNNFVLNSGKTH